MTRLPGTIPAAIKGITGGRRIVIVTHEVSMNTAMREVHPGRFPAVARYFLYRLVTNETPELNEGRLSE